MTTETATRSDGGGRSVRLAFSPKPAQAAAAEPVGRIPRVARLMALAGAEMLIYPTAIGWESSDAPDEKSRQHDAWFTIQRGHAVANGLPVITVNRVGHEPDWTGVTGGIQFWGQSFIAGPQGEVVHLSSTNAEENIVVEVDKARTEAVRRIWPFFRDRRIDYYDGLSKRYLD